LWKRKILKLIHHWEEKFGHSYLRFGRTNIEGVEGGHLKVARKAWTIEYGCVWFYICFYASVTFSMYVCIYLTCSIAMNIRKLCSDNHGFSNMQLICRYQES
jgi:hypothetical protein